MPTTRYCVTTVEINGVELDFPEEIGLDAGNMFFDPAGTSFLSDNVQEAIVESTTLSGTARTPYGFYYGQNAGVGRWLEVGSGISSETSPHIIPEPGMIKTITASVKQNTTCTIGIFVNNVLTHSVDLIASQIYYIADLTTVLAAGDTLSARVLSGSCREPNVQVKVQMDI